ncbi:MAG TPA: hypothetical protein VM582_10580, partial [Candidatus Thermoplasmatota archaeon]|nr:hypothetical protein [Candidatus Thermoplasmatota archaeon]
MKRRVAIAFAVVLLAASLVPPGGALPPAPQPAVRESILIVGDEGFLDPDSGVRGGSGTPDDPYVISDWVVVGTRGVGVRLVNTSAHVVIRHVHVDPIARQWVTLVEDCGSAWCAPGAGIDLVEVANVRLEQVSIFPGAVGLAITGSHNVTVDGIDLAGPTGAEWAVMRIPVRAIEMAHSRDSLIANATVRGSAFAARLDEVVNVTIQDSLFDGYAPVVLRRTEHVTVQRNVFLGANLHVQRAPRDLLVAENVFESDPVLFAHIFYETWHEPSVTDSSVVICRNRFRGADVAVNLYGPHQARVVG